MDDVTSAGLASVKNEVGTSDKSSSLTNQAMDSSERQDFRTPLPSKSSSKSLQAWAQHITDSGFSSAQRGAFSDRSSSVGSSIRSSPDLDTPACSRRITLGNCDFSPLTRESFSVIRSRKLSFNVSDPLPLPCRLAFDDGEGQSQESSSEEAESKEHEEASSENMSIGGAANSLSPVSPGLFTFDEDTLARQVARLSPEDLESSLQDMSLEESSSSSSSSSRSHSVSPPRLMTTSLPSEHCSKHNDGEASSAMSCASLGNHLESFTTHQQHTGFDNDTCVEPTRMRKSDSEAVCDDFVKNKFMVSLCLTSIFTRPTNNVISSLPSLSSPQSFSEDMSISQSSSSTTSHPLFLSPKTKDQLVVAFDDDLSCQTEQTLLKSPCKRISSGQNLENDSLFSPTKSRKTTCDVRKSPWKSVNRKIFPAEPAIIPSKAMLNGLSNSGLSQPHAIGMCSSSPAYTCPDPVCLKLTSNVFGASCQLADPASHKDLPEGLLKVIKTFSPSEPSRLIGRNFGVAQLDIIEGLSQSFSLCLAKILRCLTLDDLKSVSMVSKCWRRALQSDSFSWARYRQHLVDVAQRKAAHGCLGKENVGEKPVDNSAHTQMTSSKGCLSRLQAQAVVKTPQCHAEKASPTCAPLLCGEQLRRCPRCQHSALVQQNQGRASCRDPACGFDFCTQCFAAFHHPRPCKPLNRAVSKADVAGSQKSKKSLRRL